MATRRRSFGRWVDGDGSGGFDPTLAVGVVHDGDLEWANRVNHMALNALKQMRRENVNGLEQYQKVVRFEDGVEIVCSVNHGMEKVRINTPLIRINTPLIQTEVESVTPTLTTTTTYTDLTLISQYAVSTDYTSDYSTEGSGGGGGGGGITTSGTPPPDGGTYCASKPFGGIWSGVCADQVYEGLIVDVYWEGNDQIYDWTTYAIHWTCEWDPVAHTPTPYTVTRSNTGSGQYIIHWGGGGSAGDITNIYTNTSWLYSVVTNNELSERHTVTEVYHYHVESGQGSQTYERSGESITGTGVTIYGFESLGYADEGHTLIIYKLTTYRNEEESHDHYLKIDSSEMLIDSKYSDYHRLSIFDYDGVPLFVFSYFLGATEEEGSTITYVCLGYKYGNEYVNNTLQYSAFETEWVEYIVGDVTVGYNLVSGHRAIKTVTTTSVSYEYR